MRRVEDIRELARENVSSPLPLSKDREYVEGIILDVAERGDEALLDYTSRPPPFDDVKLLPAELRVSGEEIEGASALVDGGKMLAMKHSIRNLKRVSEAQLMKIPMRLQVESGVEYLRVGRPLRRVGIIVPGGLAPYPSTLLMAAVPALTAGVEEIAICTPPRSDKRVHAAILAAAGQLGLGEIYRCNLVAAVGALAFGTQTVRPVDKIVGPGNRHVSLAKQVASSYGVAMDMPAGPSELAIIADETSDGSIIAWDIMAQAEHSEDSKVFLITTSRELADDVDEEVANRVSRLRRGEIVRRSVGRNGKVFIASDEEEAVSACNLIAPEHLSIQAKNAAELSRKVRNCGTILIGRGSACAMADYATGSSHILPTGAYANVRGGLSANDFIKLISVQRVDGKAVRARWCARELAELEGFEAHGLSVAARGRRMALHNVYKKLRDSAEVSR